MDRISLAVSERTIVGKKVKKLRRDGIIPGHVFGKNLETEHVEVSLKDFTTVFKQTGETGLIDLKIGQEKVRPVLIRDIQFDPMSGGVLNIDFYQVNLKVKVTVPVPIILIGEQPESVHLGETVVLQSLAQVDVEALPTDLIENIEVNIETLKNLDDTITVGQLDIDREKLTVLADADEVVVKLAPAVTEEMKALLEEQEAEAAAAQEAVEEEAGQEAKEGLEAEGVEPVMEGESTESEASGQGQEAESKPESVGAVKDKP